MGKNIQRVRPHGVILGHGLWQHGLGLKALGLLYVLLDLTQLPDWEFSLNGLVALSRQHGMGDGRDSIRTAIAELEEKAFLVRERERNADGQLGSSNWLISDAPIPSEAPASDSPASENPTLADRLQEGSSSIEEEKKEEPPLIPPSESKSHQDFIAAAIELWNGQAPEHWVRIRGAGQKRKTMFGSLRRDFGSERLALEAMGQSLEQAHREDWCMKPAARLTIENWLSNGKVRQYQEKWAARKEVAQVALSGEQQQIARMAADHPDLFAGVVLEEGLLYVRYTVAIQHLASYPERGMVNGIGAMSAEITYLQNLQQSQVNPLAVTPF